jgi:hypothetical protein
MSRSLIHPQNSSRITGPSMCVCRFNRFKRIAWSVQLWGYIYRSHVWTTCRDALKFLCLFVFFVAGKTRAARGLFFSHKETQEDTRTCRTMSLDDYLKVPDWTGRQFRTDKRGVTPATCAPILDRLDCSEETWFDLVSNFRNRFRNEAGFLLSVRAFRSKRRERRAQTASV